MEKEKEDNILKSMDEKEKEENIQMMKFPGQWPNWPILPIINREKDTCGILLATRKPIIYEINIWKLRELGLHCISDVESSLQQEKIKSIEFKSFEEICNAGWKVNLH